jgi:hypothetical protein
MEVYMFLYTNDYDPKSITFAFPKSATLIEKKKVVENYFDYHWDLDLSEVPSDYDISKFMDEVYSMWLKHADLYHAEFVHLSLGDKAEAH